MSTKHTTTQLQEAFEADWRQEDGDIGDLFEAALFPDYQSPQAFLEARYDPEFEAQYTRFDLLTLRWVILRDTGHMVALKSIGDWLKECGLAPHNPKLKKFRTFSSNPHDRWYGPGSSPTHGCSGWVQITGFASQSGWTRG